MPRITQTHTFVAQNAFVPPLLCGEHPALTSKMLLPRFRLARPLLRGLPSPEPPRLPRRAYWCEVSLGGLSGDRFMITKYAGCRPGREREPRMPGSGAEPCVVRVPAAVGLQSPLPEPCKRCCGRWWCLDAGLATRPPGADVRVTLLWLRLANRP